MLYERKSRRRSRTSKGKEKGIPKTMKKKKTEREFLIKFSY